jgi:hypothetical protein
MTLKLPSSDVSPERCQYRTATGRQCCSVAVDPDSSFCARHAASQPGDSEDLSATLTDGTFGFQNASTINRSLAALYTLCAQGRISPRRASTLAYISSLLLRSLIAIDNDIQPHAGEPGFYAKGEHISEDDADDAPHAVSESEDPAKSQKPN